VARICDVTLRAHLTATDLKRALDDAEVCLGTKRDPAALLVDVSEMTGYENDARSMFVSWNAAHREHVTAVAIVTTNTLWAMVIAAMSLASRQKMKCFPTRSSAETWCGAQ
jgi:hypothetical protein